MAVLYSFSSALYLFSSSSSFSRFALAFIHLAAVVVLSTTWNGPFFINFSSVLCLFFFFQYLYTLCTSVSRVFKFGSRSHSLYNLKWPFCIHFLLLCTYFSSSSSFTRFARAFRHWAAVLVLSRTWNGPFCIHFPSVLCLFFFFQ